jgi:hypothetical protein
LFTVVLLLAVVVAPELAKADIVFSNLTTATGSSASEIKGSVAGGPSFFAASFSPSATYTLTDAEVAGEGSPFAADAVDIDLYLYSDSGGLPGTDLGEIGSGAVPPEVPGYTTIDASGPSLTLTSGDTYWLVMGPADADTVVFWLANGSSTVPTAAGTPGSFVSKGDLAPQFKIDGTLVTSPVPEPSSLWLAGGVAMLLCLIKRRRTEQSTR